MIAYRNTYGYEWQGDNLLLAREALLYTFMDYYQAKFGEQPAEADMLRIADIISWNLWQMDGLKFGIPGHEVKEDLDESSLNNTFFPPAPEERYCRIFDWEENKEIRYVDLITR